jgi:hypothetical protein
MSYDDGLSGFVAAGAEKFKTPSVCIGALADVLQELHMKASTTPPLCRCMCG